VNGNDLCDWVVKGSKGLQRRHAIFKDLFCLNCPKKEVPKQCSNPHLQLASQEAWDPGPDLVINEQTIEFQGRHANKRRIQELAEGDRFQCNALCNKGHTFLSKMGEEIKWTKKQREVHCFDTRTLETMEFLWLHINDNYIHAMGSMDIASAGFGQTSHSNPYCNSEWKQKRLARLSPLHSLLAVESIGGLLLFPSCVDQNVCCFLLVPVRLFQVSEQYPSKPTLHCWRYL
jgi:hypothetical protein